MLENSCTAGPAICKSTLNTKWSNKAGLVLTVVTKGASGCLMWRCRVIRLLCPPPFPALSVGLECVPFWSIWTVGGLLELGCARPFKLWLRLQRTNKSDTVRSRIVRPRADALKCAMRFSSGGIRWREKRRQQEVQSSS